VAQLPQLVTNYRRQSADALSPFFLAEWLLGDTANLLGALLRGDQPQTVVLTAQYFICMDCVLVLQYLYYTSLARRRERTFVLARRREQQRRHRAAGGHGHHRHAHGAGRAGIRSRGQAGSEAQQGTGDGGAELPETVACAGDHDGGPPGGSAAPGAVAAAGAGAGVGGGGKQLRAVAATAAAGTLLLVSAPRHGDWLIERAPALRRLLAARAVGGGGRAPWMASTGTALGYASCVLYLSSRASQLWKNHRRRSAEGLAPAMFACAIAANLAYGFALLLRSQGAAEVIASLPWLLGSLGTVSMDVSILAQGLVYGREERKHSSDEEEPLLGAAALPGGDAGV
jgi:hypothetical protein